MLIHRSSVLGIELVVTTNSYECLRAVREIETGAPGERLAAGTLAIEFVTEGRAWSIAAGGRMLRSGSHADDPAACLQDLVAELVCERLSDFTVLLAGMATLSGHRVLFVGDQAESTALLPALLAHGADLHTDHLVLVKDGTCTPFPRRFRIVKGTPPPHRSSAAFLERRVHSSAGREFRFFDPTDSGRPWNLNKGAPSVIVSLNPAGGSPVESSPTPRFAMVQQFLPTVADLARRPGRTISELSTLASTCGCFNLRTGTPGETATELLRLLRTREDGTTRPGSAGRERGAAAGAAPLTPSTAVSIIIPVYNGLKYTCECLKALRENTTGDFEVIVVDDASTDGTPEYLSTVAGITVVRNDVNLGFAGACNAGARRAGGRYLLFLNNDTVPQPGWLPPLLEIIGNREKAGVAGGRLLYPGGATVQHAGVCMSEEGLPYHIFRHHAGDAAEVVGERKMPAVTGACLMTPRALFFDVGGFDEGYVNGLEDIDYCLLVRSRGWHVYYTGASVLHHHESVSEGRLDDGRQKSNLLRFRRRWGSVIQPDDPVDYIPEDAANAPSRRYDAGSGSLSHGTGALEGPRLVCRPGVHAKGHCVYGPGLFVMNAQQLRVNFHLSVVDGPPRDGRAVSLDLYDRRHGKILCHQDVAVSRVRDSPAGLPLTATVARGQELEFRVYWHGEAEIAFSHLTASFSGSASPPDSGGATKHPEEAFREKAALRRLDALKRRDPAGFLEPEAFVEFPRAAVEQSLAARFEQQVSLHGARIAARGARRDFTYAELDGLANGIAGAILDRAGGAPGAVALLLAHDTPVCAAILGVLKAGGHYVPLDPWNPEERNAFIVADSGARLLLTDRRHRDAARALARRVGGVGVLDVEDSPAGTAVVPGVKVQPDALCFLVYTSGSTGRPKGVCQVHRNVLHTAMALTNFTGLNRGDRVSLLHSTSSVAGSTTLFGALLNGAAICPFDPGEADLDQLAGWLERERITFLSAVPTLFRRLCRRVQRGHRLEDVRLVRLVGEAATLTEWHLFNEHFPERCRLYVGLGSTEALSIRQALYDRDREPPGPILAAGGAVPDKEILLVAPDGGGVPAGGVGEIVVRSEFLFPGYWKRPDLTERVLSDDPADRRRRIFRTGDLGKFAADGSLVHVGRADSQVKIAGHRVEVAEVEHAIRQAAPVRDAAVTLHRQGARDGRLVAFVATGGDVPPDRRELRARLREALPDHMIPVSIQFVDELPLLPGGKIDRKALAGRDQTVRAEHARPRNPIEKTLVEIFQRALDVRDVGIGDDLFLDLAGDSLAAVQILSEVKTSLGRELPLSVLYEASTVAALGARLLEEGWEPPASGTLVVHPEGAGDPLFGVCGIFGHPHRLLFVGQALDPEQPFYGLQPPDMDWERAGCGTIEAMASHYLAEIRRLQPRGPYRLLGASFGGIVAFEISVQLQRAGERVALLAMVDTMPPNGAAEDGFDPVERRDLTAGIDASNRLAAMGLRVALSHRSALDRYLPQSRFDGTIVYFRCEEPAVADAVDRRRLWSRFATGGLRVVPVPGKHGRIHREPQLSVLTAGLRACLAAG